MNRVLLSLQMGELRFPLILNPSPARGEGGGAVLCVRAFGHLFERQPRQRVTVKLQRPCTLEQFPLPLGEGQGEGIFTPGVRRAMGSLQKGLFQ
ncbi:hypothetical protein CUC44_04245 [Aeromonas lusitana]|uniref:Uncharacterized protein n=1 Tax=Aeromonas lusitana TaxID=931529 RepID=A0A2M8HD76_9GAMM|nr:hypothetical protein CUC44_04245 [Aeromonas lusitana]